MKSRVRSRTVFGITIHTDPNDFVSTRDPISSAHNRNCRYASAASIIVDMKMTVRYGVNIFAFEVDEVGVGADGVAFPEVCEGCEV